MKVVQNILLLGVLPLVSRPAPGDTSQGFRVIREAMATAGTPSDRIEVEAFDGLTVELCRARGADETPTGASERGDQTASVAARALDADHRLRGGAIGQLELESIGEPYKPSPRARLYRRRAVYRFPQQEHRDVGGLSELFDPGLAQEHAGESPWPAWKVDVELGEIDDQRNTIELIWKTEGEPRHPQAIVALIYHRTNV